MLELSLYVTSACQLHCNECIMAHLMDFDKGYHMSLDEISKFLSATESSGYKILYTLTGGEPLIWKHLKPGVKMLKESSSSLGVQIFTNAVHIDKLDDEVASCLTDLRISRYDDKRNHINTNILFQRYPNLARFVPRSKFYINPKDPVKNTLPVDCMNHEFMLYNDRIYACPHSMSIAIGCNSNMLEKLSVPIKENWIEEMKNIRKMQAKEICTRCISNRKVRTQVELTNSTKLTKHTIVNKFI